MFGAFGSCLWFKCHPSMRFMFKPSPISFWKIKNKWNFLIDNESKKSTQTELTNSFFLTVFCKPKFSISSLFSFYSLHTKVVWNQSSLKDRIAFKCGTLVKPLKRFRINFSFQYKELRLDLSLQIN